MGATAATTDLLPIAQQGQTRPAGVLVAGLNPYLKFDADFRGFMSLLASQIAAGIANAVAYETERERAESLAEIDRAKTAFFSNVSHEFRTPLTLLLGPLEESLADRSGHSSADQQRLQVAHRNGLRLLKLVNSLLDFSRIEAGRVQASFEPVDIAALTGDLASGFHSLIERAGLSFTVDCPPIATPVTVDRDMWEKIVLNLLSNAFKFTFRGNITVAQRLVNDHLVLTVTDTGTGIPKHELSNVFKRFHRIEGARGRSFEGTGIGLALVQELVKLHEGSITVASEEGVGTTFTVSIPAVGSHAPVKAAPLARDIPSSSRLNLYVEEASRWTTATAGLAKKSIGPSLASAREATVLVVDDNADMREYVGRLLQDEYQLRFAADGREAIASATAAVPDLVLTDVMMPLMDGFQLVQQLRADPRTQTVPIIMLSARAGEESRVEGLRSGADDYLVKPFTAAELLARVSTHLNMARMRKQAEVTERQLRTEAEVAQRTVSHVLDSITDAFITLDRDFRITYINPEAARINGKPAKEFIGHTHWEEWPASVGSELERQYRRATQERVPVHFEHHYVDARFDLFLDIHAYPIDEGLAVYYRDVSERKRAERILQAAHERLSLAQQTGSLATWEWALDTGELVWAEGSAPLYGSPAAEMNHIDRCSERLLEEDSASTMEAVSAAIRNCSEFNREFRVRWPDGSIHWLVGRGRAIPDKTGRAVRVLGVNWDITDKKRVEAELRNERARLTELFQQAPAFIAVLRGPTFIIELTNGPYQQLIGDRDIIGKPILEALPEVESQGVPQLLQRVYSSGEPYVARAFRLQIARSPGQELEERFLDFVYQPIRDSSGQVSGIIALGVDVTEQHRAQDALVRTEKLAAVGRLAASIAHEINNPLEAVTNLVYLIQETAKDDDIKTYASLASQELRRVAEIATQTLRFHRQSSSPTLTSMSSLLDSLIAVFQGRIRNRGITFERVSKDEHPVLCLEGEARQVISNLISNAIDAASSGGRLLVRSRDYNRKTDNAPGVLITVADTGTGMSPSTRAHLFDAFYTTKEGTGTGLGLWIANGIIEKHGGTIRVRTSQNRDRHGTVFQVFFPYTMPATTKSANTSQ
jgi:PAS domain S-box-containing protein